MEMMKTQLAYIVVERTRAGAFIAVISGMGRNRNTLDASHSQRTAQRHARRLGVALPQFKYTVETSGVTL